MGGEGWDGVKWLSVCGMEELGNKGREDWYVFGWLEVGVANQAYIY